MKTIYAFHEHELRPEANERGYVKQVGKAIKNLRVPGLLHAYHLKGLKGERQSRYGVLWLFESKKAIARNFGTHKHPKWPKDWLHYENQVLASFLDRHPDKINFTDYKIVGSFPRK